MLKKTESGRVIKFLQCHTKAPIEKRPRNGVELAQRLTHCGMNVLSETNDGQRNNRRVRFEWYTTRKPECVLCCISNAGHCQIAILSNRDFPGNRRQVLYRFTESI